MKRILILSVLLHIGIVAEAQKVKKLEPLSVFNGDRKVYLEKNFGRKGYHYNNEKVSALVKDVELNFKSIHFRLRDMGDGTYQVPIIRLFFDEPEIVEQITQKGMGEIDNITIMLITDELDSNSKLLQVFIEGKSQNFVIPYDENVKKIISQLNINNSYYSTEYP